MTRFIEKDLDATHLYIDRTKDGEWSAVFLCSEVDELDTEMTRWTTGEAAMPQKWRKRSSQAGIATGIVTTDMRFSPPDRRPISFFSTALDLARTVQLEDEFHV
jgi:hypothetical protein